MKKKLLLVLLGISIVFAVLAICATTQVRAPPDERARTLAGDDLILQPIGSVNHTQSRFVALLMTSGRGLLRWDPTGLDGTPTTSLTTVATAAPNVSYPSIRSSGQAVSFRHSPELRTCSSLRSVSPNTAWFFPGDCPTVSIRPVGRSSSNNRSPTKHA